MVFRVLPGLNSKEDDVKFLGFSKNDGDGPSGAGRSSKTCPEVLHEFRVSCGKQESRLIIPLGLEFSRVDWERGTFQSCLLSQDHRFIFFILSCSS